ncbi:MAG TPA: hypothetical protein VNM66_07530 [Thermodesulfobacteriota bacterium]|nr:hypothetical protein [Thermodesulfobacteriota bacterium]
MLRETGGRLALLGALLLVSTASTVAYVSHRERDNTFCVSCHGPAGSDRPLHGALYARFVALPPPDLSAAHHRADPPVGCIGCHGGVGATGRARTLALAAFDTLLYVTRQYREPEGMRRSRLRDADCTRCHPAFPVVEVVEGEAADVPFHGHPAHQRLPVGCVDCHAAHTGGDPRLHFVDDRIVLPHCRRCHERFGQEETGG